MIIILTVLVLNLILVSPNLMPAISQIGPYDEAKYIESGRLLTRLEIRNLSWGPLVAVVYAPLHLILGNHLDWFLLEAWAGRFVLFVLLWLCTLYLARQFEEQVNPYVIVGTLFISTIFLVVVRNQSDALFTSLSALALAKLLSFHRARKIRDVLTGSALVGLSILTRVESILLVAIFLGIILFTGHRHHRIWKLVLASLLPAILLLTAYLLTVWISTGEFSLGIAGKSYDSFEMNQPIPGSAGSVEAQRLEARRLYGTSEENNGSVLLAILKNPSAFGSRIIHNLKNVPTTYLEYFGKRMGPILVFFACWGLCSVIRKKQLSQMLIMILWSSQALVALGFLMRHIIPQTSYFPLILGSIGISYIFGSDVSKREAVIAILFAIALTIYGWLDAKLAFMMVGLMTTFVLILSQLISTQNSKVGISTAVSLLLLLCAGLILRGSFDFPNYSKLGSSPEENAIHYLENELMADSVILVPNPRPAIASKMRSILLSEIPSDIITTNDFKEWLEMENISAIYLDLRYGISSKLNGLIEKGKGLYLRQGYMTENGEIHVLVVD
jgi:hypothetical protein